MCIYARNNKKKSMYLEAMPNIHLVMSNEENRKKRRGKKKEIYIFYSSRIIH